MLEESGGASAKAVDGRPIRVTAVFPEPTPYRAPLFDELAFRDDLDLRVLYAAETVAGRTWDVPLRHPNEILGGLTVPGLSRVFRHDYPITVGVWGGLSRCSPDVVVVSGWSTFAAQAAVAWCRAHRRPYVLVVESHDRDPRPGWRRAIKQAVVPRVVRGAAGVLVTGKLARESMLARGAEPNRIGVFANTIDVQQFGEQADRFGARRAELRERLGLGPADVAVLCVARLAPEKGLATLVHAVAAADDEKLVLLLVGDGPERDSLRLLAEHEGVRLQLAGDRPWEEIVEAYVAADVFALLSTRETWGVVVNEAAACGLPLVLSSGVGAAHDLVQEGGNGFMVPPDDPAAAADALARLADDGELRDSYGRASRRIVSEWGYEASVADFERLIALAAGDRRAGVGS